VPNADERFRNHAGIRTWPGKYDGGAKDTTRRPARHPSSGKPAPPLDSSSCSRRDRRAESTRDRSSCTADAQDGPGVCAVAPPQRVAGTAGRTRYPGVHMTTVQRVANIIGWVFIIIAVLGFFATGFSMDADMATADRLLG